MVDGVLLVVDAHYGPQAQTRFGLRKALENKSSRSLSLIRSTGNARRIGRRHGFRSFCRTESQDEQLDFPIIYASAKRLRHARTYTTAATT